MGSDELARRAHEYLEGTLDEAERAAFLRDLEGSPEARETLDEMNALDAVLAQWATPRPSGDFVGRVLDRIRAGGDERPGNQGRDQRLAPRSPALAPVRYWRIPSRVGIAAAVLLVVSV